MVTDDMVCSAVGHVMGCPGKAGGDHELRPLTDEERWEVGRWALRDLILPDSDVAGQQEAALRSLEDEGFEAAFIQDPQVDDRLWLFLDRFDREGHQLDEFMIEFAGYDASIVSLYNMVISKEVE